MDLVDKYLVPAVALGLAGYACYNDLSTSMAGGMLGKKGFVPLPMESPPAFSSRADARDPFVIGSKWEDVIRAREKLLRQRSVEAAAARFDADEEKWKKAQDEEEVVEIRQGGAAKVKKKRIVRRGRAGGGGDNEDPLAPGAPRISKVRLPALPRIQVRGVVVTGTAGRQTAVIDEKSVAVGDIVSGCIVLRITGDRVVLREQNYPQREFAVDATPPPPPGFKFVRERRWIDPGRGRARPRSTIIRPWAAPERSLASRSVPSAVPSPEASPGPATSPAAPAAPPAPSPTASPAPGGAGAWLSGTAASVWGRVSTYLGGGSPPTPAPRASPSPR
jgi:hypothetical protein